MLNNVESFLFMCIELCDNCLFICLIEDPSDPKPKDVQRLMKKTMKIKKGRYGKIMKKRMQAAEVRRRIW